jgi:hypothetical protein
VRGVHRVAEQRDRSRRQGVPAPGAAGAEVAPAGVVGQQPASVDLLGEQLLQVSLADRVAGPRWLRHVELVEPGAAPGRLVGLDDERRGVGRDGVAVHGEDAVRAAFVDEGQAVEEVVGAEPDELGLRRVDLGIDAELVADPGAGAVGGDHQVEVAELIEIHRRGEVQSGTERAGPVLHDGQQGAPGDRGHAVAAAPDPLPLDPHLDVVPVPAVLGQRLAQHRVGVVDAGQGAVGEHHPEAERVVGPVALEHGDLDRGVGPPDQRGEEQPTRPTTDDRHPHRSSS